jgi:hypothetical protein
MMRRLLQVAAALALLLFLAACGDFFVSTGTVVALALSPQNAAITPSKTQQFTATATLGDGSSKDVSSTATWTSSQTSVATISSSGLATAVAVGVTTITATSGKEKATTQLTVSTSVLSSLAVTPVNQSVRAAQTLQFAATGTFSDGTTRDVTTSVNWATGNSTIATITSAGLLTGVTAGTTTVTATSGTISNSTNVTVSAF